MTSRLTIALAAIIVASCADQTQTSAPDAAAQALDPTGNWTVTYTFQPACGQNASATTGTFTVTLGPMGYEVQVAGVASSGTLLCNAMECRLSGTFAWNSSGTGYQQSMNLTLDDHGKVTGTGTEVVATSSSSCTYPFTVIGMKS